ncbi:hypothetical protein LGT41_0004060 [Abyssibius alkaniclasticus]|uniref:hypothetical protein n=1 Tax=Abyssibius alkaniclasticus TaxID=2881234 RepID=UPI002363D970|nr:hypothetical protein [Abyssibius alkaniclasticus]UPH72002.1 hypothetical protein LGT41_0004060 [Abyssibius alkaniclasticus]
MALSWTALSTGAKIRQHDAPIPPVDETGGKPREKSGGKIAAPDLWRFIPVTRTARPQASHRGAFRPLFMVLVENQQKLCRFNGFSTRFHVENSVQNLCFTVIPITHRVLQQPLFFYILRKKKAWQ